jgi:pimeloyl-ACP methyl ester carboxylesterase
VLPGILGSHLKAGDKRIWLSLRLIGGLSKLKYTPGDDAGVLPDGPVGMVYDDLIDYLAASHEVIPFGFDWRRPIEEEARRLADAVDAALDARSASGQPVRLLAHSMGGVVARTLQLERPQTWARLMQHPDARLLMLGTPNGGSWAPMQVLSGDDTFGNALAAFGSPLRDRQARQLMAEMPGFIQLQARLLDPALALDQHATWKQIAEDDLKRVQDNNWWHRSAGETQEAAYEWGVPPQHVLNQARALRVRLDAQLTSELPKFADKLLLVVGRAKFTPAATNGAKKGSSTSTCPARWLGWRRPCATQFAPFCPACARGRWTANTAACRTRAAPSKPSPSSSSRATTTRLDRLATAPTLAAAVRRSARR